MTIFLRCPPTHVGTRCETRNFRFGRVEGGEGDGGENDQLTGGNYKVAV